VLEQVIPSPQPFSKPVSSFDLVSDYFLALEGKAAGEVSSFKSAGRE
jgi:hypothetical protein